MKLYLWPNGHFPLHPVSSIFWTMYITKYVHRWFVWTNPNLEYIIVWLLCIQFLLQVSVFPGMNVRLGEPAHKTNLPPSPKLWCIPFQGCTPTDWFYVTILWCILDWWVFGKDRILYARFFSRKIFFIHINKMYRCVC